MCPGWCQMGSKSPVTGREKKISIFQDSQRKHLMCDNIRCHIRISPDSDQFCRHVTSFNVHIVTTTMNTSWWKLDSHTYTSLHTELTFELWLTSLLCALSPDLSDDLSVSDVGFCQKCSGLEPSWMEREAWLRQDTRWPGHPWTEDDQLYSHRSGRLLERDWGQFSSRRSVPGPVASSLLGLASSQPSQPEAGWGGEDGSSFGGWVLGHCTDVLWAVLYSTGQRTASDGTIEVEKELANISQLIFNFMYGLQIVFLNSDLLLWSTNGWPIFFVRINWQNNTTLSWSAADKTNYLT